MGRKIVRKYRKIARKYRKIVRTLMMPVNSLIPNNFQNNCFYFQSFRDFRIFDRKIEIARNN